MTTHRGILLAPIFRHGALLTHRNFSVKTSLPLLALSMISCSPTPNRAPDIKVGDARARSTVPGRTVTAAYFTISNTGSADDALVGVISSSGPAALHSTSMADGIMRMRQIDRLPLPAGTTIRFEPGNIHLMLTELREPLAAGGNIELSLRFETSAERNVVAQVRGAGEQM